MVNFSKIILDRLDYLNLTIYGAAQLLAAETDEPVKTCNDRITRLVNGKSIDIVKLQELIEVLGGNITLVWEE